MFTAKNAVLKFPTRWTVACYCWSRFYQWSSCGRLLSSRRQHSKLVSELFKKNLSALWRVFWWLSFCWHCNPIAKTKTIIYSTIGYGQSRGIVFNIHLSVLSNCKNIISKLHAREQEYPIMDTSVFGRVFLFKRVIRISTIFIQRSLNRPLGGDPHY